jgi:hypothetical protein
MNNLTQDQKSQITKISKSAIKGAYMFNNFDVETIYDHRQTHAVYGISDKSELEDIKKALKAKGANKFRQVKNNFNRYILCFNGEKMLDNLEK